MSSGRGRDISAVTFDDAPACELSQFRSPPHEILRILSRYRTVAVVGASRNPEKDSHKVASFLSENGFEVIPLNPHCDEILGRKCHSSLKEIEQPVEIVDVFRPAAEVEGIVRDAIAIGAKVVWMQKGIVNNKAAQTAIAAGLEVVMDRCMMVEVRQMLQEGDSVED